MTSSDLMRERLEFESRNQGWSALSLGIAIVLEIHWEEFRCTLQILHGAGADTTMNGVELMMPSMGNRHFLGGIPERGDKCVVGWFATETKGDSSQKTPAILAWLPASSYLGHEWIPVQGITPDEGLMGNLKDRQKIRSFYQRIRHKLKHYNAGNIGASSSQGADLLLDESVHLSNRRSNEIILRDQDQAIVFRSLQQFHALSGARVYGGMVQRDARLLPKEMFSDGLKWDSAVQLDENGNPFIPTEENKLGFGKLEPHPLFNRGGDSHVDLEGDFVLSNTLFEADSPNGSIPPAIDPYRFLYRAGLVSDSFGDTTDNYKGEVYGGKSILRVGDAYDENAVLTGNAFTEYRIEVSHTTDGTLPVTEQTDGFDSDRLPEVRGGSDKAPFIEWVIGTPVGNDPYSTLGQESYGLPLVPEINGAIGLIKGALQATPLVDHAATLLRVKPIVESIEDSFITLTKGGKFKAYISSPQADSVQVLSKGGVSLNANLGVEVKAPRVSLDGSERVEVSGGVINISANGTDIQNGQEFSLSILGKKRVSIQSSVAVEIKAPVVDFSNAGEIRLASQSQLSLNTGAGMELSAQSMKQVALGEYNLVVSGPTNFNTPQGASRSVTIASNPASGSVGPSDKYTNVFGGRSETYLGVTTNTKTILSGTETKTIAVGSDTTLVGTNTQVIDPTGFKFLAPSGGVVVQAGLVVSVNAPSVVVTGTASVVVSAPSILLSSPGASFGPIVCGSDIHPILGVPFSTFCPPRGQNLST